jgi:hypothetical protein
VDRSREEGLAVLSRDDRRDLGHLGLVVAIYGLAFAPLLHAVYGHGGAGPSAAAHRGWVRHEAPSRDGAPEFPFHDERSPHSHTPTGEQEPAGPPAHHHPAGGGVEHLQAVALVSPLLIRLTVIWTQVEQAPLGSARPRLGRPAHSPAMPQGP